MTTPLDINTTARAIIARCHGAIRTACSESMMVDKDAGREVTAALDQLMERAAMVHQLALAARARDVIVAINAGKRSKTKAAALELLRGLRSWEHQLNLADDRAFADFVKSGGDWWVQRQEASDLRALAAREVAP